MHNSVTFSAVDYFIVISLFSVPKLASRYTWEHLFCESTISWSYTDLAGGEDGNITRTHDTNVYLHWSLLIYVYLGHRIRLRVYFVAGCETNVRKGEKCGRGTSKCAE